MEITYTKLFKLVELGAACALEDVNGEVIQVAGRVDVVEALAKAVDEHARVRGLDLNLRVRQVGPVEGDERRVGLLLKVIRVRGGVATDTVPRNGLGVHSAEEPAGALGDAEEKQGSRSGDCHVDAVLDRGEDGDEDTGKEDDKLERRGLPVLVHFPRRRDKITDGVDNDGRKTGGRDEEEDGRQGIESEKNDDSGKDTSEGRPDASLGLDGSAGEGAGGRVAAEERTEDVGETNGDEFLGRVDDVVVDTTERLGDGNVLNQEDQDGGRDVRAKGRQDLGVEARSTNVLETCRKPASEHMGIINA